MRGVLRFVGKIDVRTESYPNSIDRDRLRIDEIAELDRVGFFTIGTIGIRRHLSRRRVRNDYTRRAVENYLLAADKAVRSIAQSHHGRQSKRSRENGYMRRAR